MIVVPAEGRCKASTPSFFLCVAPPKHRWCGHDYASVGWCKACELVDLSSFTVRMSKFPLSFFACSWNVMAWKLKRLFFFACSFFTCGSKSMRCADQRRFLQTAGGLLTKDIGLMSHSLRNPLQGISRQLLWECCKPYLSRHVSVRWLECTQCDGQRVSLTHSIAVDAGRHSVSTYILESAGLLKYMRWKELFELDQPPCSSQGFVQISRNPFACSSKTPCSTRVSGVIFGKFCNTFLARWSAASWGVCPGAKTLPDRECDVKQLPTKHRTPTPIPPNGQQRAHQAKRVGLVRGGIFWEVSTAARCSRRIRQVPPRTHLQDRWVDWGIAQQSGSAGQSYAIQQRVRGLSSGHKILTEPTRKVDVICGRSSPSERFHKC